MKTRIGILWITLLAAAGCGDVSMDWDTDPSAIAFSWAWDGSRLAYWDTRDGSSGLYVADETGFCQRIAPGGTGVFAWSPDGTRLAYLTKELYSNLLTLNLVRSDGSDRRRVSSGLPLFAPLLLWSPDGSRLAYSTTEFPGPAALHTVLADGVQTVRIDTAQLIADAAWSPDGSRIAYRASTGGGRGFELRTSFADGTGRTVVTGTGEVFPGIAWTTDGAQLLFRADVESPGIAALYAAEPDGAALRLSGAANDSRHVLRGFAPAPGRAYVAYETERNPDRTAELWIADLDGGAPQRISNELAKNALHANFAWSPDGAWLAFRTAEGGLFAADPVSGGIVEIDFDVAPGLDWSPRGRHLAYLSTGGMLHTATPGSGQVTAISWCRPGLVWAPDGESILFVSDGLYTASIDDGTVARIAGGEVIGVPAWAPSGARIAFRIRGLGGSVELHMAWPFGGAIRISCG